MARFASILLVSFLTVTSPQRSAIDWKAVDQETMRHFQALLKFDTSDPPGQEKPAVDYLKLALEAEGQSPSGRPRCRLRVRSRSTACPSL